MSSKKQTTQKGQEPEHEAADASSIGEGVRTAISMLLIVHLVAILLAVSSNLRPSSDLRSNLQNAPVLSEYMRALHQHSAYNFHLTYAGDLDFDHLVELTIAPTQDGDDSEQQVLNPFSADELPFYSRTRYQNLALNMALSLEDDQIAGLLPRSVSARLLKEQGLDSGTHLFELKRLFPLNNVDYSNPDPARHDPHAENLYQTLYSADVFEYDGQWKLNKKASAGQTAPVRSRALNEEAADEGQSESSENKASEANPTLPQKGS